VSSLSRTSTTLYLLSFPTRRSSDLFLPAAVAHEAAIAGLEIVGDNRGEAVCYLAALHHLIHGERGTQGEACNAQDRECDDYGFQIGRAHAELQSLAYLVCRLLLEKK